MTADVRVV